MEQLNYIHLLRKRGVYVDPQDVGKIDAKHLWEATELLLQNKPIDNDLIPLLARCCGTSEDIDRIREHITICESERKSFLRELETRLTTPPLLAGGGKTISLEVSSQEGKFIDAARKVVEDYWNDITIRQQIFQLMITVFKRHNSPICARYENGVFTCTEYCSEDVIKRCAIFCISRFIDNNMVIHAPNEPYKHGFNKEGEAVWYCCGWPMYKYTADYNEIVYICATCESVIRAKQFEEKDNDTQ